MNQITNIFTLPKVVDILISLRLKDMRKRHDRVFYQRISDYAPSADSITATEAADYLPPRRQWCRPHRTARAGLNHEAVVRKAIWRTIAWRIEKDALDQTDWGSRLLDLHARLLKSLRNAKTRDFSPPDIIPVKKSEGDYYRIMAPCANLDDRIISGIVARYFGDIIEASLDDSCYAFRVNGTTLHDAIMNLQEYRGKFIGKPLYVAECDLRGFFDSLSHKIAIDSVKAIAAERKTTPDPCAMRLLKALLQSYSFPEYGRKVAVQKLKEQGVKGTVQWISGKERDALYGNIPDNQIGIAQGNPVSPILANAVLTPADKCVLETLGANGFYARYCDDVIMLHPVKKTCEQALNVYLQEMQKARLPVHRPVAPLSEYSKKHFGMKSRKPYRWDSQESFKSAIPWIQFVGYQIHYSGELRVRKQSVKNQKHAINYVAKRAWDIVKESQKHSGGPKLSGEEIYNMVAHRIIRAGVGDRRLKGGAMPIAEPCWLDAFPLIKPNQFTASQMRELDRHREITLRRLKNRLKKAGLWSDRDADGAADQQTKSTPYFGGPFSYFGSIDNDEPRKPTRTVWYDK